MADFDKFKGVDTEAAMTVGDLAELDVGSGKPIKRLLKPKESGFDKTSRRRSKDAVRAARKDIRNDATDLSAMTREAAMSVELPAGATHRLIGGPAAGKYVKILKFEYREGTIFVELVGVSREANKMHVPASFLALGNNNFPDLRLAEELKNGPESPYDVDAEAGVARVSGGVVDSLAVYFTPAGRRKSSEVVVAAKPAPVPAPAPEVKPVPVVKKKVVKPKPRPEKLSREEIVAAHVEPLMDGLAKIINDEDYPDQKVEILGSAKDNPEMIWVRFVGGSRPGGRTQIFYKNLAKAD